MPETKVPDALKSDLPPTTFGKILAATPVVLTVLSTLLAGLSSSEMTRAQYDRSYAAQQQSKAGDQWGYFQAKRLRSAMQNTTLELLRATATVRPLDPAGLRDAIRALPASAAAAPVLAQLDSPTGNVLLGALSGTAYPAPDPEPPTTPALQSSLEAMAQGLPEPEAAAHTTKLQPEVIEAALAAARERAQTFDARIRPLNEAVDQLDRAFAGAAGNAGAPSIARDFTAARLRYLGWRYDTEARLNQSIGNLHELQVRLFNFTAERHRLRSQRFFYGMLVVQAGVVLSTLAMAARQRNMLWSVAAVAGVLALAFAIYVYLWV